MTVRKLSAVERQLLIKILSRSVRADDYIAQLDQLLVEAVDDSGSIRFVAREDHRRNWPRPHRFIDVKGVLHDSDGVPILICPFEDESGRLYMLDVQKMGGGRIEVSLDVERMQVERV